MIECYEKNLDLPLMEMDAL